MKMNAFHPEIPVADRLSVVVLTHNRATEVVCSLSRLRCLETGPPDLARQPELVAVKALRAIYRLDVIARRARSEESIERARISGIVPGRRPTFSKRDPRRKSVNVSEALSTDTAAHLNTMHIAPVSASGQREAISTDTGFGGVGAGFQARCDTRGSTRPPHRQLSAYLFPRYSNKSSIETGFVKK
jgi:hypothetical protein